MQELNDIAIYIAMHKPCICPKLQTFKPIQVGAALSEERIPGVLYDDEGDNISNLNPWYCELTAIYWAWKNTRTDYVGFFHYRRYLAMKDVERDEDNWGNIVYGCPDKNALDDLGLTDEMIRHTMGSCDLLTVAGRHFYVPENGRIPKNVYDAYLLADFHHIEDLDTVVSVLFRKYPEYEDDVKQYLYGPVSYDCNMFIMKRELFEQYAAWLYDILFETEKLLDLSDYNRDESRVMGFLAERLFGIYYTRLKRMGKTRILEKKKALFLNTEPEILIRPVREDAVPIVLAANDDFSPCLDVTIRSVLRYASSNRYYDFIILHNKITEDNQKRILTAASNPDICSIRFFMTDSIFSGYTLFTDQHLSRETYYRLAVPELMPEYHRIVYLDCDLVVKSDVAELYDMDISGNIIGAVHDVDVAGQAGKGMDHWKEYAKDELGLKHVYDYFQAGVLIIDLDLLREHTSTEEMLAVAAKKPWRCHDQDVLNKICNGRVYYIPQEWNVLMDWREPSEGRSRMQILRMAPKRLFDEYIEAREHPKIVHYAGYQKPWDVADCDMADYFWEEAQKSPFFPMLISRISRTFTGEWIKNGKNDLSPKYQEPLKWRIVRFFLPLGSRRRAFFQRLWHKLLDR